MSDDSPPVYKRDDGKIIYRASSIGGCITALAAARRGLEKIEPRGKQQQIFTAGNEAEERYFELYPADAHYRQMEVTLNITPNIAVIAHLDAYSNNSINEIKSQSEKEYKKWTNDSWTDDPLWAKYAWQVSVCMLAMDCPTARIVRMNRDYFALFGNTGYSGLAENLSYEYIQYPFHTKEEVVARILEVEALAHEEKLVCTTPDFFCSYPYLHSAAEPVDDETLENLVTAYLTLKSQVDRISKDREDVKEQIKKHLDTQGYEKVLLLSGRQVTRSEYDTKDHMVKGSHQVRLTITEAK